MDQIPKFAPDTDEKVIQAQGILAVGRIFKTEARLWRNNTGAGKFEGSDTYVTYGIPGQADASGIIMPYGTRLEVEFKKKGKKPSPKQVIFGEMITKHGGVYLVCDGDILNQVIIPIQKHFERMCQIIR